MLRWFVAIFCLFQLGGMAGAVPVISNPGGGGSIFDWGVPDTQTYGNVFQVSGPETSLDDFSFFVQQTAGAVPFDFQGGVIEYNTATNMAVGSILFLSGQQSASFGLNGLFNQISINTGGLNLVDGSTYVAFLTTSNSAQNAFGSSWEVSSIGDSATNRFVFQNNGTNLGAIETATWTAGFISNPVRFEANFSVAGASGVPEISSASAQVPLCAILLLMMTLTVRRVGKATMAG